MLSLNLNWLWYTLGIVLVLSTKNIRFQHSSPQRMQLIVSANKKNILPCNLSIVWRFKVNLISKKQWGLDAHFLGRMKKHPKSIIWLVFYSGMAITKPKWFICSISSKNKSKMKNKNLMWKNWFLKMRPTLMMIFIHSWIFNLSKKKKTKKDKNKAWVRKIIFL